jgi:hypothetical protein
MPDNSFDIVSKIDLQEVSNAIQQAMKEIITRFDLKDSKSQIALEGKDAILLHSADEFKMKAVNDVFQQKLVKRGVPRTARAGSGKHREAEDHHAARHSDRKGARDREADQRVQKESASFDPGRPGASERQRPGHAAGDHRAVAAERLRHRYAVYELSYELKINRRDAENAEKVRSKKSDCRSKSGRTLCCSSN